MDPGAVVADALDGESPTRGASVRWLIDSADPEVDRVVSAAFAARRDQVDGASVLSRVLALRDPDRDPEYLFGHFRGPGRSAIARWWGRFEVRWYSRFPFAVLYGVTRLRRTDPVARYEADLGSVVWRGGAVAALGDTADPAAFPALVRAARSRHWRLRLTAATAARRLVRDLGPGTALPDDLAAALGANLGDRRSEVAVAAAHALVATGHTGVVERVADPPSDRAAEFEAAVRGEVPPLPTVWPEGCVVS